MEIAGRGALYAACTSQMKRHTRSCLPPPQPAYTNDELDDIGICTEWLAAIGLHPKGKRSHAQALHDLEFSDVD